MISLCPYLPVPQSLSLSDLGLESFNPEGLSLWDLSKLNTLHKLRPHRLRPSGLSLSRLRSDRLRLSWLRSFKILRRA